MIISDQNIEMVWNKATKMYYEENGFKFTKFGDKFSITVDVLTLGSTKEILIKCDYCRAEFLRPYQRHIKISSTRKIPKDNCKECRSLKATDVNKNRVVPWEKVLDTFEEKDYIVISTKEEYQNGNTLIKYICNKHTELGIQKHSYRHLIPRQQPSGYISQLGCSNCNKIKSATYQKTLKRTVIFQIDIAECKRRFEEKGATFLNDQEYKGDKHYYYFTCEKHIEKGIQKKKLNYLINKKVKFACRYCGIESRSKEQSYLWRGGKSTEAQLARQSTEYREWKEKVFKSDGYICQSCGDFRGKNLQAHHILNFSEYQELRFEISNGITLCNNCHNPNVVGSFHSMYGVERNTRDQLEEFIKIKNSQHDIDKDTIDVIKQRLTKQRLKFPFKRPASTKLTDQSVLEILERLKKGENYTNLANYFNVSKSTISEIANGKRFKDLTHDKMILKHGK